MYGDYVCILEFVHVYMYVTCIQGMYMITYVHDTHLLYHVHHVQLHVQVICRTQTTCKNS